MAPRICDLFLLKAEIEWRSSGRKVHTHLHKQAGAHAGVHAAYTTAIKRFTAAAIQELLISFFHYVKQYFVTPKLCF